ncbi:MAG: hypothetical protein E6K18_03155 [Methanobacteriota archaeon]|nr:MAG: hypothetical protein E6K18_03155 [Euryarchaeota archaeon]
MLEDGVGGPLAFAMGWLGLPPAFLLLTVCAEEYATGPPGGACFTVPGAAFLGGVWLMVWLATGMILDYGVWKATGPPEGRFHDEWA